MGAAYRLNPTVLCSVERAGEMKGLTDAIFLQHVQTGEATGVDFDLKACLLPDLVIGGHDFSMKNCTISQ